MSRLFSAFSLLARAATPIGLATALTGVSSSADTLLIEINGRLVDVPYQSFGGVTLSLDTNTSYTATYRLPTQNLSSFDNSTFNSRGIIYSFNEGSACYQFHNQSKEESFIVIGNNLTSTVLDSGPSTVLLEGNGITAGIRIPTTSSELGTVASGLNGSLGGGISFQDITKPRASTNVTDPTQAVLGTIDSVSALVVPDATNGMTILPFGRKLVLSYPNGKTLLQSTNLAKGEWQTNALCSPVIVNPAESKQGFFRLIDLMH